LPGLRVYAALATLVGLSGDFALDGASSRSGILSPESTGIGRNGMMPCNAVFCRAGSAGVQSAHPVLKILDLQGERDG
jgi:hypothetical protein